METSDYASDKWEQFGKADKGNWRYKTYVSANPIQKRLYCSNLRLNLDLRVLPDGRRTVDVRAREFVEAACGLYELDRMLKYSPSGNAGTESSTRSGC